MHQSVSRFILKESNTMLGSPRLNLYAPAFVKTVRRETPEVLHRPRIAIVEKASWGAAQYVQPTTFTTVLIPTEHRGEDSIAGGLLVCLELPRRHTPLQGTVLRCMASAIRQCL